MSILDPEKRRALMARFRGKDTKPELLVRLALHAAGRRFRLHVKDLPGRPDIVLPRDRTVIMVHGCFWHAHRGCPIAPVPATRLDFWEAKFKTTRERDERNAEALASLGWRVVTIWECEARSPSLVALLESHRLLGVNVPDQNEVESASLCERPKKKGRRSDPSGTCKTG